MTRQAKNMTMQTNSLPVSSNPPKGASALPAEVFGPRIMLLLSVFALLLIGFVMVYSASSIVAIDEGKGHASYLLRQLGFAVVGITCCVLIAKLIPYHLWAGRLVWAVWGVAVFLLILTAVIGTAGLGAQRWLNIGPISLQPSEFAKIAFLLMAARILNDFRNGALTLRALFVHVLVLILLPLMLLYRSQSDLGTTLICFFGILAVMWLGEVRLSVIVGTVVAGALFALAASLFTGYRSNRLIFLNPWNDGQEGLGGGYQLIHSFYAFAEGGLFGVGLGNSREKFLYLPEAETDFIFAIIGEELGMLGALMVIVLFCFFLYAGMRIVRKAPDNFGMLLAGGCTLMLVFQAFLNIGCVIGILPTTGKPLPFISSGGSSLIASFCMLGIILSVSQAAGEADVYTQRRADLRVIRAPEQPRQPREAYREAYREASLKPAWPSFRDGAGQDSRRTKNTQGRKTSSKTNAHSRRSRKRG